MNEKSLEGWHIFIRLSASAIVSRRYTNTKEGLRAIVDSTGLEVDLNGTTRQIGAAVLKGLHKTDNAEHGEYSVSKDYNGSFIVRRTYTNTRQGLQELSAVAGFEYNTDWNTKQFGKNLADFLVNKGLNELVSIETECDLIEDVRRDIEEFLRTENKLFFTEKDLQVRLALYLTKGLKYEQVYLDYYIPQDEEEPVKWMPNYEWNSKIYFDIVVEREGCFVPIELAYTTKSIVQPTECFGKTVSECEVLKTQGAHNLVCYDFWKDVRRIEHIVKRKYYDAQGIALFLTNDPLYSNPKSHERECAYDNFRLCEGKSGREKHWIGTPASEEGHPNFTLDDEYEVSWKSTFFGNNNEHEFQYCLIQVE